MTRTPQNRIGHESSKPRVDAEQIVTSVRQQVEAADLPDAQQFSRIFAVSIPLQRIDIIGWLRNTSLYPRSYWLSRDGSLEIATLGNLLADDVAANMSLTALQSTISRCLCRRLWACYGQAFDADRRSDQDSWGDFPKRSLQVPTITFGREGDEYFVTLAFANRPSESELEAIRRQIEAVGESHPDSTGTEIAAEIELRTDLPDRQSWNQAVDRVLTTIDSGSIQKAVLARQTRLRLDNEVLPVDLLDINCRRHPDTYRFLFAPSAEIAFLGASPERLFRLRGSQLETEAMAGTIARGANAVGDRHRDDELRRSHKDQDEHRYVVDGITERLSPLTKSLDLADEPGVIHLRHVAHLRSQISATLNPGVDLDQVLAAMHPTAAVCGLPSDDARQLLTQLEPFNRGWYSGPIGIIGAEYCEFAVALRSALIAGKCVDLYAGAGIVRGSDPDLEWLELEQKLRTQFEILAGVTV